MNTKYRINVGTWNVRTLLDLDSSKHPERRTAIVAKELARYRIDIAALSETRLSEEDQLTESGAGYTFFWKGKPNGERRVGGVGFAIRSELTNHLEQPHSFSERIMRLRVPLPSKRFVTILSVYAPTLDSSEESIMAFYQDLRAVINSIPNADKIILLGDFNARVGSDHQTWHALGKFGVGKMNSNGLHLLQLCTEYELAICNTFSHQKIAHKATWTHPRSKQGHILDYIITRMRDLQDVCTVRVMRGAECGTDHHLVRGKMKLRIMRKGRAEGTKTPKRIDVSKLKDKETCDNLEKAFESVQFDGSWEKFKTLVYDTSVDVLGLRKRKHRDWFNENDHLITNLLNAKNSLHTKLLCASKNDQISLKQSLKETKSSLQRQIRQIKNQWWLGISNDIQNAYDRKDSKALYHLINQVFGPQSSSLVPLKSKDCSILCKDSESIMKRWVEHFSDLFYNPSDINRDIIENLPQKDIILELMDLPSLEEIHKTIREINTGKAPGLDGIPVEILIHGGNKLTVEIHRLITDVWRGAPVPQDWIDAILISVFKGKGQKSVCGDYRGISLLEAVGKVFAKVLLNRLTRWICPSVLPKSQCGFRSGRGTMDMIFSVRQLQEKCIEHQVALYQVFVDLTKAFDTVNRSALWIILGKLGCPSEFVDMFKQLHRDMKGYFNFNGSLSKPIDIDNGVKQGDIPAPTLFSIYFAVTLAFAFQDCDIGVGLRFRTSGSVFNLTRFNAKSKTFDILVRELLYADDADFVAHTEEDMQSIMDLFSTACSHFGLTISLTKTKVMFTPPPGSPYIEPNIFVQGTRLEVVDTFTYLGSSVARNGSLDSEIHLRIEKASKCFGKLEKRLWADRGITTRTKLSVYNSCVLTTLLYSSETWTTYRRHIKELERFHQKCIRRILNISWQSLTPDTDVLKQADLPSIEMLLIRSQMRWAGHLTRMDDTRLPKQLFYGELHCGKRPPHKPKKRFKDVTKCNIKALEIDVDTWETQSVNRSVWRKKVYDGCKAFEKKRIQHCILKRSLRKENIPSIPENIVSDHICNLCRRVCLSKAGLISHQRSHGRNYSQSDHPRHAIQDHTSNTCIECSKICKTKAGLKRHMRTHIDNVVDFLRNPLSCHICNRECKSSAGLKSHLRAHERQQTI